MWNGIKVKATVLTICSRIMTVVGEHSYLTDFYKALSIATQEQWLTILRTFNTKQCGYIHQLASNVFLNSAINLSEKERIYLRQHISSIKELASRQVWLACKRLILVKKHLLIKRLMTIAIRQLSRNKNTFSFLATPIEGNDRGSSHSSGKWIRCRIIWHSESNVQRGKVWVTGHWVITADWTTCRVDKRR